MEHTYDASKLIGSNCETFLAMYIHVRYNQGQIILCRHLHDKVAYEPLAHTARAHCIPISVSMKQLKYEFSASPLKGC